MISKRALLYLDWLSIILTGLLVMGGLLFVLSATYTAVHPFSTFWYKQFFGALCGILIYTIFCTINLQRLTYMGAIAYVLVLLLLCYTHLAGWIGMGARRWVSLYFIRFQPAELAKLFLPAFLGYYFFRDETTSSTTISSFFTALCVLAITFLLIAKQPDLGTALIVLFVGLMLLWFIGLSSKFFAIAGLCFALGTPILWHSLKTYQQKRILVMLGNGDVRREGYQTLQAKIAIGSGGLTGKGLLRGTQNKMLFLPEDHTDFIFAVICEEWGLLGALLVLLLYTLLALRLFSNINATTRPINVIVGIGLLGHILLSVCVNIAMTCGLLPIVGIPLPLFSYGVSNLWVTLASLGWLGNIARHRNKL